VIRTYLPILIGLALGLGWALFLTEPGVTPVLLGAGAGVMGGAFVAALVTNEALIGRGSSPDDLTFPGDDLGRDGPPEE
jgi:hypothetical protein